MQFSTWVISIDEDHQYSVISPIVGGDYIYTPQGNLLQSNNKELLQLVAESMEITSDDLCNGLSPYAIESSRIDFKISVDNHTHINALLSAYERPLSACTKTEWQHIIKNASPEKLALLMSICGVIGLYNFSYNLAVNAEVPDTNTYFQICSLREVLESNSISTPHIIDGTPYSENIIDLAYDYGIAHAPYLQTKQHESACNSCTHSKYHLTNLCALNSLFEHIASYAELTSTNQLYS